MRDGELPGSGLGCEDGDSPMGHHTLKPQDFNPVFLVYVHMCVHVCVQIGMHTHMTMCRGQKSVASAFLGNSCILSSLLTLDLLANEPQLFLHLLSTGVGDTYHHITTPGLSPRC